MGRRIYFVLRCIATDELRICPAVQGYRPPPADSEFTWAGPFKSKNEARLAIVQKLPSLRNALYPQSF